MTITKLLVAALAICSTLSAATLQSTFSAETSDSPDTKETVLRFPDDGPEAKVIIEFTEPPLLGRRVETREATRAASATLESLVDRLEADIDRIEGRAGSGRTAAQATDRSVRFQYKLTFAGASAKVRRESLTALRALPYVKAVHRDVEFKMHLATSVPQIGAPQVWEQLGIRGRGVTIAIVDTGIDYNHKSLGKGFGPGFKVIGGYDLYNDDADPMDDHGHGSHVAGIAAGNLAPVLGVAPDATLLAYKVLNAGGGGDLSTIIAGVERAMDPDGNGDFSDHADVVNMSLGGPRQLNDPLVAAVERAVAAGVVFVSSAGNAFKHGTVSSPAIAPSVITVGAVDTKDLPAEFTSRGPVGPTWTVKPEVAAPGVFIKSAGLRGHTMYADGTSMAAPHVAGVAALILERHPDWTPAEVKAAIVSTAKIVLQADPEQDRSIDPTLNKLLSAGAGRVDARRAIDAAILPSPAVISFGLVTKRGAPWTSTRTVRLTNRGSAAETLTINTTKLPTGATLTMNPPSVTIDPGATVEVTLEMSLNKDTPAPNEDDIALSGALELAGSRSTLRVPFMAINVAVLSLTIAGTDPFLAAILPSSQPLPYWLESERTAGSFVPFSPVDVLLLSKSEADGRYRLVIREQIHVEGHTSRTLSPDEAAHKVLFNAVDERGTPFSELLASSADYTGFLRHTVSLPNTLTITFDNVENARELWISPLRSTVLRTQETFLGKTDRYFTLYPFLRGVSGNETVQEVRPSDWASQTVQHLCETECEVSYGAGSFSPLGYMYYPVQPGAGTWNLHITPAVENHDFRMHVLVREKTLPVGNPRINNPWTFISPPWRNTDGHVTAAPLGRITPTDYAPPSRYRPVQMGDGPVVLRTGMGKRKVEIHLSGPLGETLGENALKVNFTRFDSAGNPVPGREIHAAYMWYAEVSGPQRLEVTDEYRIAGRAGRVTQTSRFDPAVYPAAPTLTTLRVEDGSGAVATILPAGTRARLLFSGRQSTWEGSSDFYIFHYPIDAAATRAWWRPHGTADWQPLAVNTIAEDMNYAYEMPGPPGTLFSADLQAAAATPGEIDVKISLTNFYGVTTEVVYEPVVVVEPGRGKRRVVR